MLWGRWLGVIRCGLQPPPPSEHCSYVRLWQWVSNFGAYYPGFGSLRSQRLLSLLLTLTQWANWHVNGKDSMFSSKITCPKRLTRSKFGTAKVKRIGFLMPKGCGSVAKYQSTFPHNSCCVNCHFTCRITSRNKK